MLKQTLAILVATTVPALAADNVVTSHEVRFDRVSFVCEEKNESGKLVRFIHTTPGAQYIPEHELAAADPLAKSWDITYRIICEGGYQQAGNFADLRNQHSVR
jgi:hypothetical protein